MVVTNINMKHGHRNSDVFPSDMVFFSLFMSVYQRVNPSLINHDILVGSNRISSMGL